MRDYLFRGKRVDNGEWVEGYYVKAEKLDKSCYEHFIIEESADGGSHLVIPESVGQYTGMKDKNDRKIFEGDIINIEYDTTTVENCVVTYIGACFYGNTDFDSWELDYYVDIEVIGNVFKNADLLEG